MGTAKNAQSATNTNTPATPAQMLQALQSAATIKQQGVFVQAVASAFGAATPPLVLGGVQAPQRAGQISNVWLCYLQMLQQGSAPSVAQVLAALPNANSNNIKIEYYRAAKWFAAYPAWVAAQA